jgi:3-dehydroquinate synthase
VLERPRASVWGHMHSQRFSVAYDFPVVFTHDAFANDNPWLAEILRQREPGKPSRLTVFVDDGVLAARPDLERKISDYAATHSATIALTGSVIPVKGGEGIKNDPELQAALLEALRDRAVDRHSYAIAIGGGAVLDAVGYAAAIFHRGVRHIRLPTTVLSQADSGVGVKNAINAFGQKNLLGTFVPPVAVINDTAFIDPLPAREKRAGMAEAVKVALIRDATFFQWLEDESVALAGLDATALARLIEHSARLHMRQIGTAGDPFETGTARPLDFGHWAAHRLEILTGHTLSHGEAVSVGVALDARYSVLAGMLPAEDGERVVSLLRRLGLPIWHDALRTSDGENGLAVLRGLRDFREHLGGELTITLLRAIGRGEEVHTMDPALIGRSIDWLASWQAG